MTTLYMMKGLPASGKSTKAKEMLKKFGYGNIKIINKDLLRLMLDDGHWSSNNEKLVLYIRDMLIEEILARNIHVIVDDTNLAPKHEERLKKLADQCGSKFEVMDCTDVSLDDCVERDRKRPNYVGEKVIRSMWKQFLSPKVEKVEHIPGLTKCIIVDIDGTAAINTSGRSPFDWKRVSEDSPNLPVQTLMHSVLFDPAGPLIIFISGRDESCRESTKNWLHEHYGFCSPLFMRPAGDNRDDRIIKKEIYEREIKGKYNVEFVLDDRNKVVEQWRQMGLPCFQVADGDF